jgi:hypothetical protein
MDVLGQKLNALWLIRALALPWRFDSQRLPPFR